MSSTAPVFPLTSLLSGLSQPAVLTTASGGFAWANASFRALFLPGLPPESLASWEAQSPPSARLDPVWDELKRSGAAVRRYASGGGVGIFRLALVGDAEGGGVLLCSSTSAHRTLKELRERTAILEAIFHSLNEGVLALDSDQRITAFSLSAERITGFAETEVVGKVCRDVFQAPAGVECPFQTMLREGLGFHQREMDLRGKAGRPVHVAVNATLLRDPEGEIEGAVVVLRDLAELDRLRGEMRHTPGFHGMIGTHASIRRVIERIEMVGASDASVLVLGESGTGKELAARALHESSSRRAGPFVKMNCGALAETLLESELFGHVRGAFTGAVRDRAGRFEGAHGGTLFLDEIGDTSPALQVKLLRFLQEGEFERVGETKTRKADVRIVAATHKDLRSEVAAGRFRDDLFYRLCVVPIVLPPLRERRDDIPFLAEHFLKALALKEGRKKTLAAPVFGFLQAYPWPGNVRELENALAHAYVCTPGDVILPETLPEHVLQSFDAPPAHRVPDEARALRDALDACGGNKGEAARRLGLSRTTLWRRMRELGVSEREPRPA